MPGAWSADQASSIIGPTGSRPRFAYSARQLGQDRPPGHPQPVARPEQPGHAAAPEKTSASMSLPDTLSSVRPADSGSIHRWALAPKAEWSQDLLTSP